MNIPKFQYNKKLKNARVLVRVDFNVPMHRGKILDDARMRASLPTIQKLIERKAKVIIVAHLGRPDGRIVTKHSLQPLAIHLSALLDQKVSFIPGNAMAGMKKGVAKIKGGQVAMLENIRFHKGEVRGEEVFTRELSTLGDVFVLDGFGVAHRDTPSVTGLGVHLPSFAGYLLQSEIEALDVFRTSSPADTIAIIGGAKVATKLPVIEALLAHADTILLGGAIVNTFFKAKGYRVGKSLLDTKYEFDAIQVMKRKRVITPVDVIVGSLDGKQYRVANIGKNDRLIALPDEYILDIGPKTIQLYAKHIATAKSIFWNGTMGYFEQTPYHIGTYAMALLVGARTNGAAFGVVGGGETIEAVHKVQMPEHIDHMSTGGGALLAYIADGTLPGIEALHGNK